MEFLIDFILHLDQHLVAIVNEYGTLTYVLLFLIVFTETGLIVMPFLPGDSLLFAAGAISALPSSALNIVIIIPLLLAAALLGDNVNYFVGRFAGDFIKSKERILFFKREYIEQTELFYQKHGAKTIIMARFVPIVRTIAPFVAGAGNMNYKNYFLNCVLGAILWVSSLSLLGYVFGNIPIVKNNFDKVIISIVLISILPMIIGYIKNRKAKKVSSINL
jgi:membrane-associated protein